MKDNKKGVAINGFINLNKGVGISSAGLVNKIKRLVYPNRIGHMGTLDPLASGVLVVGIGKATRLFDYMLEKRKTYVAEFTFGKTTETLDSGSECCEEKEFKASYLDIEKAVEKMVGKCNQMPPLYSAKSVNGVRAYDLARKGVEFELKTKEIEIYSFKLIEKTGDNTYSFEIVCSGGTYIRSIARDLGIALGSVAYMSSLQRAKSGDFDIKDSFDIEQVSTSEELNKAIVSTEEILKNLDKFDYDKSEYKKISNGVAVDKPKNIKEPFVIYCDGVMFGLSKPSKDNKTQVGVYLKDEDN